MKRVTINKSKLTIFNLFPLIYYFVLFILMFITVLIHNYTWNDIVKVLFGMIFICLIAYLPLLEYVSYKNSNKKKLIYPNDISKELKDKSVKEYESILSKYSIEELIQKMKDSEYKKWISYKSILKKLWLLIVPIIAAIVTKLISNYLTEQSEFIALNITEITPYILISIPMIIYFVLFIIEFIYSLHIEFTDSIEKQIENRIIKKLISKELKIEL